MVESDVNKTEEDNIADKDGKSSDIEDCEMQEVPITTCNFDHSKVFEFKQEELASQCGEEYYLAGKACNKCNRKYVPLIDKFDGGTEQWYFKPTSKCPISICPNMLLKEAPCTYSLCFHCFREISCDKVDCAREKRIRRNNRKYDD